MLTYIEEELARAWQTLTLLRGIWKVEASQLVCHRLLVENIGSKFLESRHTARNEVTELDEPLSTSQHLFHEVHGAVIESGHVELPNMDENIVEVPLAPHVLEKLAVENLSHLSVNMRRLIELRNLLWLVDQGDQLLLELLVGGVFILRFLSKGIGVVDRVGYRHFGSNTTGVR